MGYLNHYGLRYLLGLLKNYIYNTTSDFEALLRGPIKEEIKEEVKNSINNNIDQELLSLYFAEEDLSIDNRKIIYTSASLNPLSIDAGREIISESFDENTKEGIIIYDKAVRKVNSITGNPVTILLPKTTKVLPSISTSDLIGIEGDGSLLSYRFNSAKKLQYVRPKLLNIPSNAFSGCSSLISVTIGDSVTTIGYEAFRGCISLTSVTIGDSVTTIGKYAFYSCSSLTSVTIPDSVTEIGDDAFYGCSSLTSVHIIDLSAWCKINFESSYANPLCYAKNLYLNNELVKELVIPSDITEIKPYAFRDCSSLTSVTIGDSVTSIGDFAFRGCESLESVTIPDSVTSIGYNAFRNCISLTSVTIPDSVTAIGNNAFGYCTSLTSVTIPDSVTTIGKHAFQSCYILTSITIPDGVTTIGEDAFWECSSLTSVYCKATTPPAGGTDMFYNNASGRKIYVPMESVEAYKSASYWSDYADAIEGYNFD